MIHVQLHRNMCIGPDARNEDRTLNSSFLREKAQKTVRVVHRRLHPGIEILWCACIRILAFDRCI